MGLRLLGLLLLLAGCGYKGPLTRIEPGALPPAELKEARAAERLAMEAGLKPTAEQRPVRVDDISIRLEDRPDDPFNLPPER